MTTYKEFQAELERLHQQAERARRADKGKALERVRALIIEYRVSPEELGLASGKELRVSKVAAKYRNPKTGATWSGRGREPLWIRGKDRNKFTITLRDES